MRLPYLLINVALTVCAVALSPSVSVAQGSGQAAAIAAEVESYDFEAALANFGKVKFKNTMGKTEYSIKPKSNGAKLVDAQEKELARYTSSARKMKIKDAKDKTLAYIIFAAPHFHIEDAQQQQRLWKFQRQSDGDWKLEKQNQTLVNRVKKRDYGYEVESATKKSLYKAKLKGEKTSLRDAKDKTKLSTKNKISTLSVACLGLDAIQDERVRIGLAIAVQMQEGSE